ncbi:potassium voltage-gated channel protein Shaw-like [Saccostrea echinata]|uniref:potassium voltage-gated channel protein Shaw-like n=1 Tax=Saccostrea echinata TaxID=191078 RepID=UPI002A82FBFF|nr:potassium voltage-gated channel protein Shaw-like [Saccostrea echinata]
MNESFEINLRGTKFLSTSPFVRDLMHALVKADQAATHPNGGFYVDRNPMIFHHILDYHSGGEFHLPKNICPLQARKEIEFWRIPSKGIHNCCYESLYNENEYQYTSIENLESDLKVQTNRSVSPMFGEKKVKNCLGRLRYKLLEAYLHPFTTWTGRVWLFISALVTITSVVVYLLNSDQHFRVSREGLPVLPYNLTYNMIVKNKKYLVFITTTREYVKSILEFFTNTFLLLELLVIFVITHQKRRFLLSLQNILNIATGLAVYVAWYIDVYSISTWENEHLDNFLIALGVFQSLRVIRFLRLVEFTPEMKILKLSLHESWREFVLLLMVLTAFSLIFGSIMFWVELDNPDTFPTVFISIWWAIITMTTVGYGDFYPKTVEGYCVAIVAAIFGLLLLAMPITILASNFNTFYNCYKYRKRHVLSK